MRWSPESTPATGSPALASGVSARRGSDLSIDLDLALINRGSAARRLAGGHFIQGLVALAQGLLGVEEENPHGRRLLLADDDREALCGFAGCRPVLVLDPLVDLGDPFR